MIDLVQLRAEPRQFANAWENRGLTVDVDALLDLDSTVRQLKTDSETKRAEANAASKAIGQAAKEGKDINEAREQARQLGEAARALDAQRAEAEESLKARLLELPNPCLGSVPVGQSENDNKAVSTWGEAPAYDFSPKPHWDLAPELDIIDFDRGARLSGSGFVVYKGLGARLNRALINYFLTTLVEEFDYTELGVPLLVSPDAMQGTGQLPKFGDQLYKCADDDLYLIPTAEVPVTNYLGGEMLEADALPMCLTAYTPCFRREAGAAGLGTRGITRMHQFDKVEMVWLSTPERSEEDLLTMRGHAETLLQRLGLHYRILELCTGDTGFSSAHTYDLEVWSPGTGTWLEVSSCSLFTDFQARRANLRYRPEAGARPQYLHTLNGSGLALPRTLIAVLETCQTADGNVTIPEVLQPFMGCKELLSLVTS